MRRRFRRDEPRRELTVSYGRRRHDVALSLSQEEFAFRVGVNRTYLGGIERGERNPSLRNLAAIAKGLGVSLSELFSF